MLSDTHTHTYTCKLKQKPQRNMACTVSVSASVYLYLWLPCACIVLSFHIITNPCPPPHSPCAFYLICSALCLPVCLFVLISHASCFVCLCFLLLLLVVLFLVNILARIANRLKVSLPIFFCVYVTFWSRLPFTESRRRRRQLFVKYFDLCLAAFDRWRVFHILRLNHRVIKANCEHLLKCWYKHNELGLNQDCRQQKIRLACAPYKWRVLKK